MTCGENELQLGGRAGNSGLLGIASRQKKCSGRGKRKELLKCNSGSDARIATSFSVSVVHGIFSNLSDEKHEIIRYLGFGVLLKLSPHTKFPRLLALWIIRNMDPVTGAISVGSGASIKANDSDLRLVLGIPCNTKVVKCGSPVSPLDVARVKRILMLKNGEDITLECIESILTRDYGRKMNKTVIEAFKVAVVLYADAYFLGPKGRKARINQDMFRNLAQPGLIPELNWCSYVLSCLIHSSNRVQESISTGNKTLTIDGCLLFCVVSWLKS